MENTAVKLKDCLLAAAIGDICGSPWEFAAFKQLTLEGMKETLTYDYSQIKNLLDLNLTPLNENRNKLSIRYPHSPMATDDSICTFAIAEAVLNGKDIKENLINRCKQHINIGYGGSFVKWLIAEHHEPYNSFGNGSAMRCSIAGWIGNDIREVTKLARESAEMTHNHPEGINGAIITAQSIFRARRGWSKEYIVDSILEMYPNKWRELTWDDIIRDYKFDVTCQGSLPVVAMALRESTDFESCILKCIQSGGDCDTLGAIAAPIAYALYREIPVWMQALPSRFLPTWCMDVNEQCNKYLGF